MLKKLILAIVFIVCVSYAEAQTMKWLCGPRYDKIEILNERLYRATRDGKIGILNSSGKLIYDLEYDEVTPFQEGRALLLKVGPTGLKEISCLIDGYGNLIRCFDGMNYLPSVDYPYYKEGKMVYLDASQGNFICKCGYLDKDGNEIIPAKYLYAAPFNEGKAVVRHASDSYFGVINEAGTNAALIRKPLQFISSIIDGQAIGWRASSRGGVLVRLRLSGGIMEEVAVISEGHGQPKFKSASYSKLMYGQDVYNFDEALRYIGKNSVEEREPIKLPRYPRGGSSLLSIYEYDSSYGIIYDDEVVLLPCFKSLRPLRENVVSVVDDNGLTGLLALDKDAAVSFIETDKEFVIRPDDELPELSWLIYMQGLESDDVDVMLISDSTNDKTILPCMCEYGGINKIVLPYEFSSTSGSYITENFDAFIMVNGLPSVYQRLAVAYVRQVPYDDMSITIF